MGDHESEGSGTAKVGTDEQNLGAADLTTEGSKLHTEAGYGGQGNTTYQSLQPTTVASRCSRDWPKEHALTGGGLGLDSVFL